MIGNIIIHFYDISQCHVISIQPITGNQVTENLLQFDLSYPAMSGPALIRIRDLAGYGRLNV